MDCYTIHVIEKMACMVLYLSSIRHNEVCRINVP